ANGGDGLVVAEADRFPEEIADRRADQVPLLANREGRPGVDRRQARLDLRELVAAPAGPQPLGRRPPLPLVANVLPLLLPDRAPLRRDVRMLRHWRELNAAGLANECCHAKVLLDPLCPQSGIITAWLSPESGFEASCRQEAAARLMRRPQSQPASR